MDNGNGRFPEIVSNDLVLVFRYHGKSLIKESSRYNMTIVQDTKLYYLVKLVINKVESSDGGEYTAIAKNKIGEGKATINLNFEGGGKPK